MYNDYRGTNRETWKYTYTGEQMVIHALTKLAEVSKKETLARETAAALLHDASIRSDDPRLSQTRKDIEQFGNEAEQARVFVNEFTRNPSREFQLSLGDVVYFSLENDGAAVAELRSLAAGIYDAVRRGDIFTDAPEKRKSAVEFVERIIFLFDRLGLVKSLKPEQAQSGHQSQGELAS